LLLPTARAAHYIVGRVYDAYDGTPANGHTVVLWNPAVGMQDNITDVIGPSGNSGNDNIYMLDCEMLQNGCSVGDTLNVKVINTGDDYVSETTSVTVSGAGFDVAPDLRLNSKPTVTINSPADNANISGYVVFNCTGVNWDNNLANITLYGNWSGGWHANETKQASSGEAIVFEKNLSEGVYIWACRATDNLSISGWSQNYTLRIDTTPPTIHSTAVNQSYGCENEYVRVECNVSDNFDVFDVWVQAIKQTGEENYTASSNAVYYADILIDSVGQWQFYCWARDYANNTASAYVGNITAHTSLPDLIVYSQDIVFSNYAPKERENVTINATVYNDGCASANNFVVAFFEDNTSKQLDNTTISLGRLDNATVSAVWQAKIGPTEIIVWADYNESITEYNESNNNASTGINVTAWQYIYGNASVDKLLATYGLKNMTMWLNQSHTIGNIFITDIEASIDWLSLQAVGKNTAGDNGNNDFDEIDTLLGMTNFNDSVAKLFSLDGSTAKQTKTFLVHQRNIYNVPIYNTSNFTTGILWDTSDDSNGEFDTSDKEDLVFVVDVQEATQGKFGIYDYEIMIPVKLRNYYTTDTEQVYIYYELH